MTSIVTGTGLTLSVISAARRCRTIVIKNTVGNHMSIDPFQIPLFTCLAVMPPFRHAILVYNLEGTDVGQPFGTLAWRHITDRVRKTTKQRSLERVYRHENGCHFPAFFLSLFYSYVPIT